MSQVEWPKNWVRYDKHRKATLKSCQNGKAREFTNQNKSHSQYHKKSFSSDEEVQAVELKCIEQGVEIPVATVRKRTFYINVEPVVAGYCCGYTTKYVFAEWLESGEYHGRPMCEQCLRQKGIEL